MSYRFYTTSKRAWDNMYHALERARQYILIEMYIFLPDTPEYDFVGLLRSKAEAGIQVVVVLDGFGSMNFSRSRQQELRRAGVELRFASRYRHRLHRKIVIVDQSIVFTGGVNIHESAKYWVDLAISTTNKFLIQRLTNVFIGDYHWSGGANPAVLALKNSTPVGRARAKIVEHFPALKPHRLRQDYHRYFTEAKEAIIITTPYFAPKRYILAEIHQACLRGVRVILLLPSRTDHTSIDSLNIYFLNKAQRLGAEIYLSTDMNHAKTIIIDSRAALVGSQNLDVLSFRLNAEAGIELTNRETVLRLRKVLLQWLNAAYPYNPNGHPLSWWEKIAGNAIEALVYLI